MTFATSSNRVFDIILKCFSCFYKVSVSEVMQNKEICVIYDLFMIFYVQYVITENYFGF